MTSTHSPALGTACIILIGSLDYVCFRLVKLIISVKSRGDLSCASFSDMVPLLSLQTRRGVSTSLTTSRKINSTKTGGAVPGGSTRIWVKNTVGKLPSPRGRQVNSEEQWILMAIRFNVYVFFFKEGFYVLYSCLPPGFFQVAFCLGVKTSLHANSIHITVFFTVTIFRQMKAIFRREVFLVESF